MWNKLSLSNGTHISLKCVDWTLEAHHKTLVIFSCLNRFHAKLTRTLSESTDNKRRLAAVEVNTINCLPPPGHFFRGSVRVFVSSEHNNIRLQQCRLTTYKFIVVFILSCSVYTENPCVRYSKNLMNLQLAFTVLFLISVREIMGFYLLHRYFFRIGCNLSSEIFSLRTLFPCAIFIRSGCW